MSIFGNKHQHHWKVTGATYHGPTDGLTSVKNISGEMMRELLHGFTVLTQQCEECGWVSTSRRAGRAALESHGIRWSSDTASQ